MNDQRPKAVETRVHEAYSRFSETEQKIANVILDAPGELSSYTATELASLAGVSKASCSRFFQGLGFSTFEEARKLAREMRSWGSPLYVDAKPQTHHVRHKEYFDNEIELLNKTISNIDPVILDEIVHEICGAKRVWIVGFRNSQYLAGYLRSQLLQFRGDVNTISSSSASLGEYTADFTKQDLVIGIGLRRRPKEFGQILEIAQTEGSQILLITDPTARRLPALANWTLMSETETPYIFDSSTAALSLIRLIAISAFNQAGKPGKAHMERVERQHEILGDLD